MQTSYSPKPHNRVDYYPLANGYADVFLHRNETEEADEDGSLVYKAEEVYFQIEQAVTKEQIEQNFDYMWQDTEHPKATPTADERLEALEQAMLELVLGGV